MLPLYSGYYSAAGAGKGAQLSIRVGRNSQLQCCAAVPSSQANGHETEDETMLPETGV